MLFRLLGSLQATAGGVQADLGGHKQRMVLAALLLHPNEVVPADRLIEWVWSDTPPRTAAHSIHVYVSELRKALEPIGADHIIVTREPGYVIEVPPGSVDIDRFEELLRAADAHLQAGGVHEAADCAREALGLWMGDPLADFAYDEFAQEEIRLLTERRIQGEALLARAEMDEGDFEAVIARLHRLTAKHPMREDIHGVLMEALFRNGRTAEALEVFQGLRRRLSDQLGIDPSRDLFDLEERILLQDPTLQAAGKGGEARNPFKGLRPFEETDAGDFFGRTALVEHTIASLAAGTRFQALVGPSGGGKSSVARAGLLPELRAGRVPGSESWLIAVITPGADPFGALATGVRSMVPDAPDVMGPAELLSILTAPDLEILLLIDQFEELFTLVGDEWVREGFLHVLAEALAAPGSRFRLIATMRGDFYDRPLMYPAFGDLFTRSVVSIMPLTPAELGEAVAEPARRVGTAAEPELIAALVADVAGRSGALPLFQYSLTELFERKSTNTLTLADYRSLGGLEGTLVGHAERAYEALTGQQQRAVRQIMLRLLQVGVDDTTALRRVPASEISSLPIDALDLREALERFGALRLLSFGRSVAGSPTIEIAHEALLTVWPRLADWIEANRADLKKRATLQNSIQAWLDAGEDPDYLPAGTQLAELERWHDENDLALTSLEHRFIEAARSNRTAREEAAAHVADEARMLQRRAQWRLWGLVGLLVLIVGAVVAAVVIASDRAGPKVALIYDGRGDQSFGDLEAAGWDRALREHAVQGDEIIPIADAVSEFRSAAEAGTDLIIGGGFIYSGALAEVAAEYPGTSFAIIDTAVELPNVTSYLFGHAEGSYLAGVAAALASESSTVGFVGGAPIPLIEEFRAGFEAGALATDPDIQVLTSYVGSDFATAFSRPDLGRQAAQVLLDAGADVVYHAAGTSGWGVLEAVVTHAVATGEQRWFIGVDTDQWLQTSDVARTYVLTSMLKRVDVAIERAIADFTTGALDPGVTLLSLSDGGVSLAESGGYIARFEGELADARSRLLAGGAAISAPTGPVLEWADAAPAPDIGFRITFDGSEARFAGPSPLASVARAAVQVDNSAAVPTFVAFIPILDDTLSIDDLARFAEASDAGEVPDHLDLSRAQGQIIEPGSGSFTVALGPGRWGVYCTVETPTGNAAFLAGLVEVVE